MALCADIIETTYKCYSNRAMFLKPIPERNKLKVLWRVLTGKPVENPPDPDGRPAYSPSGLMKAGAAEVGSPPGPPRLPQSISE
jgi:hypothetical protein